MPAALAACLAMVLLNARCEGTSPVSPDPPSAQPELLVLRNVTVVPMDADRRLEAHSIVVHRGRIEEIGPAAEVDSPAGALVIDGRGRYVMPGLVDMHVHVNNAAELRAYLGHGVTRLRNMWGYPQLLVLIEQVEAGTVTGPAIHTLSSGLDAPPGVWPVTQPVSTAAEAEATVAAMAMAGYSTMKVYNSLSASSYDAIVEAAHSRGLAVAGHVPFAVPVEHAIDSGQLSIEHMSGFNRAIGGWATLDMARLQPLIERARRAGTWICPTLAVQRRSAPQTAIENRRRAVRAFHDAGARLLIGTDAGIEITAPGAGMITEITEFAAAGLSPYEILYIATRNAAAYLGMEEFVGIVRTGAVADLLLLDDDPLRDPLAATRPAGVVLRGRWLNGEDLR
jgi:imidazolonepropionase-like amidohydrolase